MNAASPLRAISTLSIVLVCVFVLTPSSASAWSFSSIFGNDDDDEGLGSISVDKSNGSDVTMQQPLLKDTDWFLTEEEITASRGGSPRTDMATYSTGNAVTTFTVTKEFFDSAYDDLSTTKENDRVMLASWNTDLIPLVPDVDPSGAKSNFDVVFGNIVKRGGDVKILGWANKFLFFQDVKVRSKINKLPSSGINDANALFIFDDRLPYGMSSHHQKTLVIASGNSTGADEHPVAYVGGIDLSNDRWDTIYHNESQLRKEANIHFRNRGWVDSSMRIHGPAAKDVANNFLARWNSPYLPTQGLGDDLVDFNNPQHSFLPPLDYASSNTTSALGNQSVQIVRTFSCKYKHWEFAPYGENSLFQTRIKAVKNAKNYIYIEDQYFILVPELLDASMEVMPGLQRLIVVVQPPELLTKSGGYEKYMYENVQPLKEMFPNKFKLYSIKPELDVYMHSKLVVIDDVYLADGSANWNRRSMTSDPELDANVVDSDVVESPNGIKVGRLIRDFRVRKFQEMTTRKLTPCSSWKPRICTTRQLQKNRQISSLLLLCSPAACWRGAAHRQRVSTTIDFAAARRRLCLDLDNKDEFVLVEYPTSSESWAVGGFVPTTVLILNRSTIARALAGELPYCGSVSTKMSRIEVKWHSSQPLRLDEERRRQFATFTAPAINAVTKATI